MGPRERCSPVCPSPAGMHAVRCLRFAACFLAGVALLHVLEFHLGLGSRGSFSQHLASVVFMLKHCPLTGPLALIGMLFVLVGASTLAFMSKQLKTLRMLDSRLLKKGPQVEAEKELEARIPLLTGRSISFAVACWASLTLCIGFALLLLQDLVPMQSLMLMQGHQMLMSRTLPLPVWPTTMVIAFVGTVILFLCEKRLEVLTNAILERFRLLFSGPQRVHQAFSARPQVAISKQFGPSLFSRPPPSLSSI